MKDQYSSYRVRVRRSRPGKRNSTEEELAVNGVTTLGENIADNGGVKV